MSAKQYSKEDCIESLREAAEQLGHSPTTEEYAELGISPSKNTIARRLGGWNDAKKKAGVGLLVASPREGVNPEILNISDEKFQERTSEYMNLAEAAEIKMKRGCNRCPYDENPAALQFHHKNADDKFMGVGRLINQGYSRQTIREEIEKCEVLCANCHRVETDGELFDV